MLALKFLLIFIEIICSLLLIGIILLQKTKGEGLGMAFGAEMGESLFGARASNVLVKVTAWLGVIFILNTVMLAMMYTNRPRVSLPGGNARAPIEQPAATPMPSAPISSAPNVPAPGIPAPVIPTETGD